MADGKRRVVFKTENNVTREFHKHSKVATRAAPNVSQADKPLKSAIKAPRQAKQEEKKAKKTAKFASAK